MRVNTQWSAIGNLKFFSSYLGINVEQGHTHMCDMLRKLSWLTSNALKWEGVNTTKRRGRRTNNFITLLKHTVLLLNNTFDSRYFKQLIFVNSDTYTHMKIPPTAIRFIRSVSHFCLSWGWCNSFMSLIWVICCSLISSSSLGFFAFVPFALLLRLSIFAVLVGTWK